MRSMIGAFSRLSLRLSSLKVDGGLRPSDSAIDLLWLDAGLMLSGLEMSLR